MGLVVNVLGEECVTFGSTVDFKAVLPSGMRSLSNTVLDHLIINPLPFMRFLILAVQIILVVERSETLQVLKCSENVLPLSIFIQVFVIYGLVTEIECELFQRKGVSDESLLEHVHL